jgi:transposase, IS5 family
MRQHRLPLDRSSMSRWRQRIGAERLETLLADTPAIAQGSVLRNPPRWSAPALTPPCRPRPWPIPPTATWCCAPSSGPHRPRALARRQGIALRQSFARVARPGRREAARLLHGRGHRQGMRHLRTFLGRIIRDVTRKTAGDPVREAAFAEPLARAERIRNQRPRDAGKLWGSEPGRPLKQALRRLQ